MSAIHKRDAKGRIVKGGSVGGKNQTSWKRGEAAIETTKPEMTAELMAMVSASPEEAIARMAEACGFPKSTAREFIKRLQSRYQPVAEAAKGLTNTTLIKAIEEKIPLFMDALTPAKINEATAQQITTSMAIMIDKRQLLKGEPTAIMTYEQRSNLADLMPAILKEAERRGKVVDTTFREVPEVQIVDS